MFKSMLTNNDKQNNISKTWNAVVPAVRLIRDFKAYNLHRAQRLANKRIGNPKKGLQSPSKTALRILLAEWYPSPLCRPNLYKERVVDFCG